MDRDTKLVFAVVAALLLSSAAFGVFGTSRDRPFDDYHDHCIGPPHQNC